jgi:hypothetical protein
MVTTKQVRRWLHRRDGVDFGVLRHDGPAIEWVEPTAFDSTLQSLLSRIEAGHLNCDPVGHFNLYRATDGRHALIFEEWTV